MQQPDAVGQVLGPQAARDEASTLARNLDRYYPYDAAYLNSGWPDARQQRSSRHRRGLIRKGPPPMATVEEGLQTQIRNIEATYGKPMSEWLAIIAASGLTKHTDIVNMLKNDYGMTHGAAHRVSILARQSAAQHTGADQDSDLVSALYTGKKASLRPIHDALMSVIRGFGDDIELAPKKGYVSLRRRKQFAMIQPSGAGRIDLGLILPDVPADARLESAGGFNALFTHRVRLSSPADINTQLTGWLKRAYDRAQ